MRDDLRSHAHDGPAQRGRGGGCVGVRDRLPHALHHALRLDTPPERRVRLLQILPQLASVPVPKDRLGVGGRVVGSVGRVEDPRESFNPADPIQAPGLAQVSGDRHDVDRCAAVGEGEDRAVDDGVSGRGQILGDDEQANRWDRGRVEHQRPDQRALRIAPAIDVGEGQQFRCHRRGRRRHSPPPAASRAISRPIRSMSRRRDRRARRRAAAEPAHIRWSRRASRSASRTISGGVFFMNGTPADRGDSHRGACRERPAPDRMAAGSRRARAPRRPRPGASPRAPGRRRGRMRAGPRQSRRG